MAGSMLLPMPGGKARVASRTARAAHAATDAAEAAFKTADKLADLKYAKEDVLSNLLRWESSPALQKVISAENAMDMSPIQLESVMERVAAEAVGDVSKAGTLVRMPQPVARAAEAAAKYGDEAAAFAASGKMNASIVDDAARIRATPGAKLIKPGSQKATRHADDVIDYDSMMEASLQRTERGIAPKRASKPGVDYTSGRTPAADSLIAQARALLTAPAAPGHRAHTPALNMLRDGAESLKSDAIKRLGYVDEATSSALRALRKEEATIRMLGNRSLQLIANAISDVAFFANAGSMSDAQRRAMFAKKGAGSSASKPLPPPRNPNPTEPPPPGYQWGIDPKTGRKVPVKIPKTPPEAPVAPMPGVIDDTKAPPRIVPKPAPVTRDAIPAIPAPDTSNRVPITGPSFPGAPSNPATPGTDMWPGGTPPWVFDPRTGKPNPGYIHPDNPYLKKKEPLPVAPVEPPPKYSETIGGKIKIRRKVQ